MITPPILPAQIWGEDALLTYYRSGNKRFTASKSGDNGFLMITEYTPDFDEVNVYVNERAFPGIIRTLEKLMQLFPIKQLLLRYDALLLHSSQVALGGKGILFTAPSGTGKSTQARLWQTYAGAEIVCNDRTLIQPVADVIHTFGYPLDGSEPVSTGSCHCLGAIVALNQAPENTVCQLRAAQALKALMDQTVVDAWNREDLLRVQELWIRVLYTHPVFALNCKPDQDSVKCLMIELQKKGVISDE